MGGWIVIAIIKLKNYCNGNFILQQVRTVKNYLFVVVCRRVLMFMNVLEMIIYVFHTALQIQF